MKKILAFVLLALTAACSASPTSTGESGKKVLLAVSFGTSYNDNRDLSIGGIENALQKAYPDYEIRRAFTSQIIIDVLKERDKLEIDNATEAMERLVADGVKEVVIQPTHIMGGFEYDDVIAEIEPFKSKFDSLKIGPPLLTEDSDFEAVAKVLTEETDSFANDGTAIVYMGHGTEHDANGVYAKLQQTLIDLGCDNYFVGTVEAEPTLEEVVAEVKASGVSKVVLAPFMIVAGDHANNDMAGDEADSWKSVFESEGFEVECVLKGIGQYKGVQDLIVKHSPIER